MPDTSNPHSLRTELDPQQPCPACGGINGYHACDAAEREALELVPAGELVPTTEVVVDEYGTTFTIRRRPEWTHVQLLVRDDDGGEPWSYGFTPADFARFAEAVARFAEAVAIVDGAKVDPEGGRS